MNEFDPAEDDVPEEKSKSQLKREMTALQDLGKQLASLKEAQLAEFPLEEDLRQALRDYNRITKNEAKRRQLQYIGKLMRRADHEGIQSCFDAITAEHRRGIQQEKLAESWRERLLEGDADQVTAFLDAYPATDRQEFRNLVRSAVQEKAKKKPPTQARKLFRFIRDTLK